MHIVEDCYHLLGIKSSASAAEIKRAYRQKAKEIHPDISDSLGTGADNASRMRQLILAYETISNPERRAEFDATYAKFRQYSEGTDAVSGFDYRLWLIEREDNESRSKLIFFDLFHGLEDEAVSEYLAQRGKDGGFILSRYFDREDFMDCGFVLAEELTFREEYYEAFLLLAEVMHLERIKAYFKHFYPEVIILVRDLIKNHLALSMTDELSLDCLEIALELGLGKKDDSHILKLMAECYERIGDRYTARICLLEALKLDPALKGIRDLQRRLEVKNDQNKK